MNETIDFATATAMEIREGDQSTIVPIEQEVVYHFEKGLPAFEDCQNFIFIMDEKISPFICMQSLDRANLSFVCLDPFTVKENYNVRISESVMETLEIENADDVLVLTVVTVNPDMEKTTANLMGPIILNVRHNKGQQIILENVEPELVRYNLWEGIVALEAREQTGSQVG